MLIFRDMYGVEVKFKKNGISIVLFVFIVGNLLIIGWIGMLKKGIY